MKRRSVGGKCGSTRTAYEPRRLTLRQVTMFIKIFITEACGVLPCETNESVPRFHISGSLAVAKPALRVGQVPFQVPDKALGQRALKQLEPLRVGQLSTAAEYTRVGKIALKENEHAKAWCVGLKRVDDVVDVLKPMRVDGISSSQQPLKCGPVIIRTSAQNREYRLKRFINVRKDLEQLFLFGEFSLRRHSIKCSKKLIYRIEDGTLKDGQRGHSGRWVFVICLGYWRG